MVVPVVVVVDDLVAVVEVPVAGVGVGVGLAVCPAALDDETHMKATKAAQNKKNDWSDCR